MKAIPLTVPFKGDRNYAHSTDVYTAILCALEETEDIPATALRDVDFVFRSVCSKQLNLTREKQTESNHAASISFELYGKSQKWFLYQTNVPILDRVPFDEECFVARAEIDVEDRFVTLSSALRHQGTLIEIVVALNKALHLKIFPETKGKWLFTQIQTKSALWKIYPEVITICLVKQFGLHLTRSSIQFDGDLVGHVSFSLKNEHRD